MPVTVLGKRQTKTHHHNNSQKNSCPHELMYFEETRPGLINILAQELNLGKNSQDSRTQR